MSFDLHAHIRWGAFGTFNKFPPVFEMRPGPGHGECLTNLLEACAEMDQALLVRHCQETLISDSLFAVDCHSPLGEVLRRGRRNDHIATGTSMVFLFFRFSPTFHLGNILIHHAEM